MLKTLVRHTITYLPSKLLPALTGFITAPILTRLFLPAEYGYWALALGVVDFLFALACSGVGSVPFRFLPAYKTRSELGVFFVTLGVLSGIVIAVVSAVSFLILHILRGWLPPDLYPLLMISVLIFIVQALFVIARGALQAQQRSGLYSFFELLNVYGSLGAGLLLVIVFGFGVDGLLWGQFLAVALALPILLVLVTRGVHLRTGHWQGAAALQFWQYAWPLALGNMAMWGLRLSDRYLIGLFRPASEVGLYSVAYNISGKSVSLLVQLLLLSSGPLLMNAWETQGREAAEKSLAMISRLYLTVCLPAAAGVSFLARPFVALLTSEAYHEGYRIVGYIAFSSFAGGLSQIAILGTLIKKNTRRIAINQAAAALVNLGLNLVLVPRFGFVAAGFTTLIGYAVLFVLQAHASRQYLTWRFPFRTLRNIVIATTFVGLAIWGVYAGPWSRGDSHWGYLAVSIVVAVPVYFVCLLLLGEANQEERAIAERFLCSVVAKARRTGSKGLSDEHA
jgi:O-antigen/teichoic acid export membrane protein